MSTNDFPLHARETASELDGPAPIANDLPSMPIIEATIVGEPLATTEPQPSSPGLLERFLQNFFRQENIRWMAVIGAAIIVASSLMLVTHQWSSWSTLAKYLVILAYTGLSFLLSELGRKSFGLQITARVLQFLTLLLIPICFLSLAWLFAPTSASWSAAGLQALLCMIPALLMATYIARKIFDHLWRGHQTTFLVSYLILCASGALPRLSEPTPAALATIVFWLAMTIGTIKINRHLFWITEEHRFPRAFGFLPIALLGLQFIVLMITKVIGGLPWEWMGFTTVLVAATILLTGRTIYHVHQQRTGGLIKVLPIEIIVPLAVGVAVALIGVVVSFYGFSYTSQTTYAAVPTLVLAAYLMFQVGLDARRSAFIWLSLVLMLVGYQCLPAMAQSLVHALKSSAAASVGEQRLPIAFYGLTYIPLILLVTGMASMARARGLTFVEVPCRRFVAGLCLVLMVLSWTHIKAVVLVAMVQLPLYLVLASVFRDRRFALLALPSVTVAVGTAPAFLASHGWVSWSELDGTFALACLGLIMLACRPLDDLLLRWPIAEQTNGAVRKLLDSLAGRTVFLWAMMLTFGLLATWFSFAGLRETFGGFTHRAAFSWILWVELAILATNLLVIASRLRNYIIGLVFWIVVAAASVFVMLHLRVHLSGISDVLTAVFVVVSLLARWPLKGLHRFAAEDGKPQSMGVVLLYPLYDLCIGLGLKLALFVYLPAVVLSNLAFQPLFASIGVWMTLGWLIALRILFDNRPAGNLALLTAPLIASATAHTFVPDAMGFEEVNFLWSSIVLGLIVSQTMLKLAASQQHLKSDGRSETPSSAFVNGEFGKAILSAWLIAIVTLGFGSLAWIGGAAVALGLCGGVLLYRDAMNATRWTMLGIAVNVQLLICCLRWMGFGYWAVIPSQLTAIDQEWLLVALTASAAFWSKSLKVWDTEIQTAWSAILRITYACLLAWTTLVVLQHNEPQMLLLAAIAMAVGVEVRQSVQKQNVLYLWTAFSLMVVATILVIDGQPSWMVSIGIPTSVLAIAVSALVSARRLRDHARFGYACPTFTQIGLISPMLAVVGTLFHYGPKQDVSMLAVQSLVMLASAAIYFHHGSTTDKKRFLLLAGCILNVASIRFWYAMEIWDAQLYLIPIGLTILATVELLKHEMNVRTRSGMRYVGALTILVSPVFEILQGSWLHLLALMVLSVLTILLAIGIRARALVNTGTAFLMADLLGMVVRSAVDHPGWLWVGGLAVGVAVIGLAAVCENHRERLLQRIRLLSAELATWN